MRARPCIIVFILILSAAAAAAAADAAAAAAADWFRWGLRLRALSCDWLV